MAGERLLENVPMSEHERKIRIALAACYRLAQKNGWDELIYNHISARVPGREHHFLINPPAFEEVTASNLVKVNIEGRFIGDSKYRINTAGFTIHSAIHGARPEVGCAIHLPTEAGMTLSVLEDGLLPLTQTAMLFQNQPHFTITRVSRSISQRVSALFATLATNPS